MPRKLRVNNYKFARAVAGVVIPALIAFIAPNILFRFLGLAAISFHVVKVDEATFSPAWIYFLAAFCAFSYLAILLAVASHVTRARYLGPLRALSLFAVEVIIASAVLYAVLTRSSAPMSGLNVVGQGVMEAALSGHLVVGYDLTVFNAFDLMHSIFTFTAAYTATVCAVNFSIFALPYHGATDRNLTWFRTLYKEHLYATIVVWCIGIVQLVAWLRLPVSSISPDQTAAFTRHVLAVSAFYSLNYTLVLLTGIAASASLRQQSRRSGEVNEMETALLDNKLVLVVAAPFITGFLANVLSAYFG